MTLNELFPKSKNNHYGSTFEVIELPIPLRTTVKCKIMCTVCNCIVFMKAQKVFACQKACKCSTMYYRNSERRLERLLDNLDMKSISLVSPIPDNLKWYTYLDLHCNICGYVWTTQENGIVNYNAGCPKCAGTKKLTLKELTERFNSLIGNSKIKNFQLIDEDFSGRMIIDCICGKQYIAKMRNVYYSPYSCPECASSGFKSKDPATLYLLELLDQDKNIIGYKYGISNSEQDRHKKIDRTFLSGSISLWCSWYYVHGWVAQQHELTFKKAFKSIANSTTMKDGWTETFDKEYLSTFLAIQQHQYDERSSWILSF